MDSPGGATWGAGSGGGGGEDGVGGVLNCGHELVNHGHNLVIHGNKIIHLKPQFTNLWERIKDFVPTN